MLIAQGHAGPQDSHIGQLAKALSPGDLLVVNNSLVIPAALKATRPARARGGGGAVNVTVNLLDRADDSQWWAFAKPGKRLRPGDNVHFSDTLRATVKTKGEGGRVLLAFTLAGTALDTAISAIGTPPLPPYIAARRPVENRDKDDYQTLFAKAPGSVAAPTAGLHFTPQLLESLDNKGIARAEVTLHVGAGTFAPIAAQDIADKRLHTERFHIPEATVHAIETTKAQGGSVIAVGTTSLRAIESAYDPSTKRLRAGSAHTQLFIQPGDTIHVADRLMTNFHLPRSSLFMLVCAFAGTDIAKRAYAHAIANQYRFYSYGDACLFDRGR